MLTAERCGFDSRLQLFEDSDDLLFGERGLAHVDYFRGQARFHISTVGHLAGTMAPEKAAPLLLVAPTGIESDTTAQPETTDDD